MTVLSRACVSPVFHRCLYLVPFLRYAVSKNAWSDLETGRMGRSRSLKMAPFHKSYTTFYWSAIVSSSSSRPSSSISSVVIWTHVADLCVQSIVQNNFQSQLPVNDMSSLSRRALNVFMVGEAAT